jgi:nitrite reductase/ring-hydroxylating ferredoxin subunit
MTRTSAACGSADQWLSVLPEAALLPGRAVRVEVDGVRLIVGRTAHGVFAARDVCPHLDLPLAAFGPVEVRGERLVCPWHFWEFDVQTGRCEYAPLYRDDELFFFQIEGKERPAGESAGQLCRVPARLAGHTVQVLLPMSELRTGGV